MTPDLQRLTRQQHQRYLAGLFPKLGILIIEGKKKKGCSSERPFSIAGIGGKSMRTARAGISVSHSPCAPHSAPCRVQGQAGSGPAAAFTSHSTASAANSAMSAVNSAMRPSNSAMLTSTSTALHLTPPQSSALNSAEFDANPTEPGSTSNEIVTNRYQVTSPGYSSRVISLTRTKQVIGHFFGGGHFFGECEQTANRKKPSDGQGPRISGRQQRRNGPGETEARR